MAACSLLFVMKKVMVSHFVNKLPISLCVHPLSCNVQKLCTYLHPSSGDDEINHHESLSSVNIHDKDDGLTLCEQLS
jgi:hypothetical protein